MGADPSLFSLQLSVLKWKSVQVDGVLVACDNEAISLQCHVLLGAGPVVCWGRGVCCGGDRWWLGNPSGDITDGLCHNQLSWKLNGGRFVAGGGLVGWKC